MARRKTESVEIEKADVSAKTEEVTVESENTSKSEAKKRNEKKKEIPKTYEIPVRSNVAGQLVYVSKKNQGLRLVWDHPGDVEYVEFGELISMRNTARSFFENNMIMIEESDYTPDDVYNALSVQKYYEFDLDNIDDIFKMSESELDELASTISNGFKENIVMRAIALYDEGSDLFDSAKRKALFEKKFNFKFEEDF